MCRWRQDGFWGWRPRRCDYLDDCHRAFAIRAQADIPTFPGAYLHVGFFLPFFGHGCSSKLDLYFPHFLPVGRGEKAVVAYPHECRGQYVHG